VAQFAEFGGASVLESPSRYRCNSSFWTKPPRCFGFPQKSRSKLTIVVTVSRPRLLTSAQRWWLIRRQDYQMDGIDELGFYG